MGLVVAGAGGGEAEDTVVGVGGGFVVEAGEWGPEGFFGFGVFEDFHSAEEGEAFVVEAADAFEIDARFGVFAVVGDVLR